MKEIFGMISVFLATFISATGAVFAKLAAESFHQFDIALLRFIVQLILVSIGCLYIKKNPFKEPYLGKQVLRGCLGAITFICALWGNSNMEMSSATMIRFVGPLFTMVLAKVYLKETISNTKYFALVIGFLGVVLVAKPSFIFGTQIHRDYPNRHIAVFINIISALTLSVSTVLTKKIINKVHILSLMYFFALISIFTSIPLQFFKSTPPQSASLLLPFLVAISYFISQLLSNIGIKTIPASVATLIQISDTIFGVLYGVLVFQERLDIFSIIGCVLVLSVSLILAYEKFKSKPRPSKHYSKLSDVPDMADIELAKIVKQSVK